MIFHILKKDLKLLWPVVLLLSSLHAITATVFQVIGVYGEPQFLRYLWYMLAYLSLLGVGILSLSVFHQDPIPGTSQDWLIRPINRTELLFSKVLFVLLLVCGPIVLVDVGAGLAASQSFGLALSGAVARSISVIIVIALPAMIIGAVTKNAIDALLMTLVLVVSACAVLLGMWVLNSTGLGLIGTGLQWGIGLVVAIVVGAIAVVVLTLQFRSRKTFLSRGLILAGAITTPLVIWVPWNGAFSVQRHLGQSGSVELPVQIEFATNASSADRVESDVADSSSVLQSAFSRRFAVELGHSVEVSGLDPGKLLYIDRVDIRIIERGQLLYYGEANVISDKVEGVYFHGSLPNVPLVAEEGGTVIALQKILIPKRVYPELEGKSVTIELTYFLTQMRKSDGFNVAVFDRDQKILNLGVCSSRIGNNGLVVQMGCRSAGQVPDCAILMLRDSASGIHNEPRRICNPSYGYFGFKLLSPLSAYNATLPFRGETDLFRYPCSGSINPDTNLGGNLPP
jgi:hypothetical protein